MTDEAQTIHDTTQATMSGGVGDAGVQNTLPASSKLDGLSEYDTMRVLTEDYLNGTLKFATEDTASSEQQVEEGQEQAAEEIPLTPQEETPIDGNQEPEGDPTAIKEIRIKAASSDDQAAMRIYKASISSGVPMTLAEAVALVQSKKSGNATEDGTESQTATGTVETVESLEAEIERLEGELLSAGNDFKTAEMTQAMIELRKAERKLSEAKQAQAIAATQQNADLQTADEQAIAKYSDAGVPGSAMWNTMAEIHATMKRTNDPRLNDPNLPLMVADWAALSLGKPATATTAAPKAPVVQTKKPTVPQIRPLQGGTVGTPSGGVDGGVLLQNIKTAAELDAVTQAWLNSRAS